MPDNCAVSKASASVPAQAALPTAWGVVSVFSKAKSILNVHYGHDCRKPKMVAHSPNDVLLIITTDYTLCPTDLSLIITTDYTHSPLTFHLSLQRTIHTPH